jgi:hypothetical protein
MTTHDSIEPPITCSVCGGPLGKLNKIGICRGSPECRAEAKKAHDRDYHARHKDERSERVASARAASPTFCAVCGGRVSKVSKYKICKQTPECRAVLAAITHVRAKVKPCELCGTLTSSDYGVCTGNRECKSEHDHRWSEANPPDREKARAKTRAWTAENPLRAAVNAARRYARLDGCPFDEDAVRSVWPPPEKCPAPGCGKIMVRSTGSRKTSDSPALTRIIAAFGYVTGNLRWMCSSCCMREVHRRRKFDRPVI